MILYAIIPNIAYALETGKPELKLTTDKTTVKRGEEVTLTLSLNTNSNKSVASIQSYINYDSNIFEVSKITRGIKNILTQEEQDSGSESETYMANIDIPGRINVLYTVSKSFEYNGTVCQIVLKAKQNAQIGKSDFIINADERYPVNGGSDTGGGHKPIESTIINSNVEIIASLESISLTSTSNELWVGETAKLTVDYKPTDTTEKGVTYKLSDEKIAIVSTDGIVTAVGKGIAKIEAIGANNITSSINVTVKQPITGVSLDKTVLELERGETATLVASISPENNDGDRTITWKSSNDQVAIVEGGKVTAKGKGTAYIKAKVEDKEISCKIDVLVPLTEIELNKTNVELLKGQNDKLSVKLVPEDTTYTGTIEWSSSDESVVTVDKNGNINGLKEGTALITVKAIENGNEIIATSEVTVKEIPLDSIEIDISNFDLEIGKTEKLNIICNPENTTDNINIEWSSSNEKVATIDQNGNIEALSVGTTVITAKVGEKTASVEVTVKAIPITSIEINAPVKVLIGGTFDVQITVNPENATYNMSDIKFISSNSDVLFVNEDGTIFAKGLGKAILTVETVNGVKTQTEIEVVDSTIDYPEEDPTDDLENNEENDNKPNEEDKTEQQNPIDDSENEKQEENNSNSPKTGDLKIEVLITLMIISVIGIVIILFRKLKK